MATVIIINVYFRAATTHAMPDIVRDIFLKFLPRVLMMKRPERIPIYNGYFVEEYCVEDIFDASKFAWGLVPGMHSSITHNFAGLVMPSIAATILPFSQVAFGDRRGAPKFPEKHHRNCSQVKKMPKSWSVIRKNQTQNHNTNPIASPIFTETRFSATPKQSSTDLFTGKYTFGPSTSATENLSSLEHAEHSHEQRISKELQSTIESIAYIAEHVKTEMSDKKVSARIRGSSTTEHNADP